MHTTTTEHLCGYRAISMSHLETSTAKHCSSRWATWPSAAAPPAHRPTPNPATCCGHWDSPAEKPGSGLGFGLGRSNEAGGVAFAIEGVVEAVSKLRKLPSSPAAV